MHYRGHVRFGAPRRALQQADVTIPAACALPSPLAGIWHPRGSAPPFWRGLQCSTPVHKHHAAFFLPSPAISPLGLPGVSSCIAGPRTSSHHPSRTSVARRQPGWHSTRRCRTGPPVMSAPGRYNKHPPLRAFPAGPRVAQPASLGDWAGLASFRPRRSFGWPHNHRNTAASAPAPSQNRPLILGPPAFPGCPSP